MPTDDNNGNSNSRLDRIERIVEVLANTQIEMQGDIRVLLTSQVLMTESIQKLTADVQKLTADVQELADSVHDLRDQAKQTDANLGVLLLTVDEIIRGKKPGAQDEGQK